MEKAILKKRKTGGASKHEEHYWNRVKGGFGFNGVMGGTKWRKQYWKRVKGGIWF